MILFTKEQKTKNASANTHKYIQRVYFENIVNENILKYELSYLTEVQLFC